MAPGIYFPEGRVLRGEKETQRSCTRQLRRQQHLKNNGMLDSTIAKSRFTKHPILRCLSSVNMVRSSSLIGMYVMIHFTHKQAGPTQLMVSEIQRFCCWHVFRLTYYGMIRNCSEAEAMQPTVFQGAHKFFMQICVSGVSKAWLRQNFKPSQMSLESIAC